MKEKERLSKIRTFIMERKMATWKQIKEATGISDKELSYDLKKLIGRGEVEAEKDMKDRRVTWYKLKDKLKVVSEAKRYEIVKFIDSLKEPIYYETQRKIGGYTILVSAFGETQTPFREKQQRILEETLNKALKNLSKDNIMCFGSTADEEQFSKVVMVLAYQKE